MAAESKSDIKRGASNIPILECKVPGKRGAASAGKIKRKLNVPCIGWIYSTRNEENKEFKAPIIIWWLEPDPPTYTKRRLYYSFLDEKNVPMRTNMSKGIRREVREFSAEGWTSGRITNTTRSFYAVPKMVNTLNMGNETNFSGLNIWKDFDIVSVIPSYIGSDQELVNQGLLAREGDENMLTRARDSDNGDMQRIYRNIVLRSCVEGNGDHGDICSTPAVEDPPVERSLRNVAMMLGWELPAFMQYIFDNTQLNFGSLGRHIFEQAGKELELAQYILFVEKGYSPTVDGNLVAPDGSLVRGLKVPNVAPPWIQ